MDELKMEKFWKEINTAIDKGKKHQKREKREKNLWKSDRK